MYRDGEGVTKDTAEALKWLQLPTGQVSSWAQDKIREIKAREMSEKSEGVVQNRAASVARAALSLNDNGHAWQEASMSARTALCSDIAGYYGGNSLTKDYKYWYYNIDECYRYRPSETLGLSIEFVVKTIETTRSINEGIAERQKYLGR